MKPTAQRACGVSVGGISGVAAGILFLLTSVLGLVVGDPPSDSGQLPAWVTSHHVPLALTNEILAFAAVLLLPLALDLYRVLDGSERPWVALGCAVLAVDTVLLLGLVVVQGRLVYPVYGITLDDPATVALIVSLYYGGAHLVALLLGLALVTLGLAMRASAFGRAVGACGIVAGALQIAGAFPWLIGPLLTCLVQAGLAAWLVLVGGKLALSPAFR